MSAHRKSDRQATISAAPSDQFAAEPRSLLLVIEDALIHSTIIGLIAEKIGYSATTARSYQDARKALSLREFDCITLDLGLGEHIGAEVLHYLAEIRCRAQIIVISGSEKNVCDQTARIGRALDLNIREPVPKPIDLKALRDTLTEVRAQSLVQRALDAV